MIAYVCFNTEGTVAHSPAAGMYRVTKCQRILEGEEEFEWREFSLESFTLFRCHQCKEFDTAEVCKMGQWPKKTDGIRNRIQEMIDTPEEEWDVITDGILDHIQEMLDTPEEEWDVINQEFRRCGLLTLKNDATKKAIREGC